MPEVILSYPRVPHPDTDDLLHEEGRRKTLNRLLCVKEKGKFLLTERGSAMTNITRIRIGKS